MAQFLRAAGLPEDFRFHNLRHTFGSTVIRVADARELMEWMGHADLATTRRYLAFIDRADAARRVSEAFRGTWRTLEPSPTAAKGQLDRQVKRRAQISIDQMPVGVKRVSRRVVANPALHAKGR